MAPPKLRALPALGTERPVAIDRASNGVEQLLLAERLRQELDRAGLHRPHRHGDVAVAGEEDDRHLGVRLDELALQIQPTQPREAHVEYEASRRVETTGVQERPRARKYLDLESHRCDEPAQRVTYRRIVVDDEDNGPRGRRVEGGATRYLTSWRMFGFAHAAPSALRIASRRTGPPTGFSRSAVAPA